MRASHNPHAILIVDDEPAVLKSLSSFFEDSGYRVYEATSGNEGLDIFKRYRPALVFTDLRMPGMDGLDFMRTLKEISPETPIVVISGTGVVSEAIQAVKLGAWDLITKPIVNLEELDIIAKRALETAELRSEVSALRNQILLGELSCREAFAPILTSNEGMRRIFQYVEAIAPTSQPVLISGQTGTGKELVARAVHEVSGRKGGFVAVNLGGLDDAMFSDTLFGHLRGAFTGAERQRDGMIAQAADGTLFLDEIGELPDASQVKLMRLLQEQEYYPLGSDTPRKSNARIVAATNRDLRVMVESGRFRQDLFYRLCTHQVTIPPLVARKGDIPLLLEHFVEEAASSINKAAPRVPTELCHYLAAYDFPGNVRELKAMTYDAVARHTHGPLSKESFLNAMGRRRPTAVSLTMDWCPTLRDAFGDRLPSLKEAQEILIQAALERAEGNQGAAARYLGITRQGLNKILNRNRTLRPND